MIGIAFAAQILLGIAIVGLVWTRALPAMREAAAAPEPGGSRGLGPIVELWFPLATTLPAVIAMTAMQARATEAAARPAGAIAGAALAGLGVWFMAGRRTDDASVPLASRRALGGAVSAVLAAGVVVSVLALDRHLPVWVGQIAFAMLAVLLWTTVPDGDDPNPASPVRRAATAVLLAVGLGAIQGFAARMATQGGPAVASVSAALLSVQIVLLTAPVGGLAGDWGRRAIAWIAGFGILGAIGTVALARLPQLVADTAAGMAGESGVLASGFGAWAPEAVALLLVAAGCGMQLPRRETWGVRPLGGVTLVAAAIVLLHRLLGS